MFNITFTVSKETLEALSKMRSGIEIFKPYISEAMEASLYTVRNNSFDFYTRSPYLFDFKDPIIGKGHRTGFLARTMRDTAVEEANRLVFNGNKLTAVVASKMEYADYVARRNDFYSRILAYSQRQIDRHFDMAAKKALNKL